MNIGTYMEQLSEQEREELLSLIETKQTEPSLLDPKITDEQEEIGPHNKLELLS